MFETTRNRRPQEDWVPSARMVSKQVEDGPLLLPEGFRVVDRPGRFRQGDEWWVFEPAPGDPPLPTLRLLPNAVLEAAVLTLVNAEVPPEFSLSGEILLFDRHNYLLLRLAVRHHEPAPPAAGDLETKADAAVIPQGASSAANSRPESGDAANPTPSEGTEPLDPEKFMDLMRVERPRREVVRSAAVESEPAARFLASPSAAAAPLPDQVPLVRRMGRLTREGFWWSFSFEAGQENETDVPLRLLPCQALTHMLAAQEGAPPDPVFVVSGEVTAYDGLNYLLVRSATRRLELGNLKR